MDQDRFDIDYEGSRILADTRVNGDVKSNKDICLNGLIYIVQAVSLSIEMLW